MSIPMMKPKRKNPVLRTPQMNLPPSARGRVALGLAAAAAEGRLELQVCECCGAVQYPPREACCKCLSPQLRWRLLYQGRLEDSGQIDAASEDEALAALVDRVTANISSRYIVRPGQALPYRLRVTGVASLDDWQAVTGHAARLAGVSNLRTVGLAGSELLLDLNFTGDVRQLQALLSLEPGFVECGTAAAVDPTVTTTLCWKAGVKP